MNKLSRLSTALALGALLAAPALAAPQTFVLDPGHSFPRFSYSHFGFSTQLSRFRHTTGSIVYDKAAKTATVDIEIDAKSVDTGVPLLDEHIQDKDFFDTARFPTASFKSTAVRFVGDKPVSIDGQLTVKGITKPVTLTVTSFKEGQNPILKKEAIGANAYVVVKRSDFDMAKYAPNVSDEVRIDIAVEAIAKQ